MSYTDLFNRCIIVILQNEGGYVNHPNDPGGETNMGIAKKFYPNLDIKNLTRNQVIEIYFRDYWSKMNLKNIYNEELILHIFDMGINAGIRTAIKMVQRLVKVSADGFVGPITTNAINCFNGNLVDLYIRKRSKYYHSLARKNPTLQVFLNGWINRIDKCKFE